MSTRKTKSISFNLVETHEKELLAYVEDKQRGNFSRYIKRLIAQDMAGTPQTYQAPVTSIKSTTKKEVIKTDTMGSFL